LVFLLDYDGPIKYALHVKGEKYELVPETITLMW